MSRPTFRCMSLALSLAAGAGCASKSETKPDQNGVAAPAAQAAPAADATAEKLRAALAAPHRSEKNRVRDPQRHPVETLTFFGLRDDMTVVELWPGGGWYTEILAPVLKERGKLIVTSYDVNGDPENYNTKNAKNLRAMLDKDPAIYGGVQTAIVNPPDQITLGAPGSADLVVTFRNYHSWLNNKFADKVVKAAHDVLKPGGVFGVVEHRAKPGMDLKTGYVEESVIIKAAEDAGFKLEAKSEVNANPKDTKDHPDGVWSLPPSLRGGDKERDKFVAIGESDRMTLKFVKK